VLRLKALAFVIQYLIQRLALFVFATAYLAILCATIAPSFGILPWIQMNLRWDGLTVPNAGIFVQTGIIILAVGICFFLPSNSGIIQLENSHRQFSICLTDVSRTYGAVHAADRGYAFRLSNEFDSVRERLAYLCDKPDLSSLAPTVLKVATQMSHVTKELAKVCSNERVTRT
jgi:hypothetical protein